MPSAHSKFKRAMLSGLLLASAVAFAEEKPDVFTVPTTNSFLTNSAAQQKRQNAKRVLDAPREFGIFSPLRTPAPSSFGDGQGAPGGNLFVPRPAAPAPEKDDAGKKDWIFAQPGDFSAEDAFKVKGLGSKDKKDLSGFEKFIVNEPKSSQASRTDRDETRFGQKGDDSRFSNRQETSKFDSRPMGDPRMNESLRDFGSRTGSSTVEDRTSGLSTKSSIMGEFFRGDSVAQERWAEQATLRRNEFQQMFATKGPTESGLPASVAPPVAQALTEFNRSSQNNSDPWKNDDKLFSGRSSFEEVNARQTPTAGPSSFSTPTAARPQYQPAVLPFPKRPGELFK